jgi:hypothetical protein
MTRFFDVFADDDDDESGNGVDPGHAFEVAVAHSRLRLWKPSDPIADRGIRVLVGTATWSGYDMRLLDVIDEALARMGTDAPLIEVFDASYLPSQEAYRDYIPGLPMVFHTPVAGVWHDGVLRERAEGYDARELVARMFGSSSDEIVEFVRRFRAVRAS